MGWWWTSSKETEQLEKELPADLQQFFKDNNPDARHRDKYELSPQQKRVNQVLNQHKAEYSYDFEKYKRQNNIQTAALTNCAELQLKVVDCFRSWNPTKLDRCAEEMNKNTKCLEIQKEAFKKLHYDDCYSVDHCDKIRFLVDKLFVDHYGRYGEEITADAIESFDRDLDKAFNKVWK